MRNIRPNAASVPFHQISDSDLRHYVEGTLSASRRSEIEGYLACNPDLAARVMQAMHQRERIGILQGAAQAGRARIRTFTLCLACAIAGWAVAQSLDEDGPFHDLRVTPDYVEDAVMSQRVAHVRIGMMSQTETPRLDAEEIEHATGIRMPTLDSNWQLLDTQIYPSEEGPSVSVLMRNSQGERMNLFAVGADTTANEIPVVAKEHGEYAVYWEQDGAAYVLTGEGSSAELLHHANALARSALM
jgi:anti-sigma factor RsiW